MSSSKTRSQITLTSSSSSVEGKALQGSIDIRHTGWYHNMRGEEHYTKKVSHVVVPMVVKESIGL